MANTVTFSRRCEGMQNIHVNGVHVGDVCKASYGATITLYNTVDRIVLKVVVDSRPMTYGREAAQRLLSVLTLNQVIDMHHISRAGWFEMIRLAEIVRKG